MCDSRVTRQRAESSSLTPGWRRPGGIGGAFGTSGGGTFQKASPRGCTGALPSTWAQSRGPAPPAGGGGTRGGGQAGGRVTRSGCSPDSLQPGRVGAQRHAEAAAEPDAAVRGDQPAPARFPPAVPGPRLVPLPHPGGNETGDRSTQPFPGEGGGLGAWRGTAHSPGCRDTADPAACGPSGRSLALTACF